MQSCDFICTVRNGEQYIHECISSVCDSHPESRLIVVDDGSSDGTVKVVTSLMDKYSKVRLIETRGIGRGNALNLALQNSTSKYVANIDADDIALPGRSVLIEYLEVADDAIAVVSGSCFVANGANAGERKYDHMPSKGDCIFRNVTGMLYRANPLSHIAVVMRREAVMEVGGYDESRRSQLDYDLWVRLAHAGYQLHRADVPVAVKRIHSSQSFEKDRHLRYVLSSVEVQLRAATTFRQRTMGCFFAMLRLGWAIVPRTVRLPLSASVKSLVGKGT